MSADDLLAYARGEAGAGVTEHVARCPSCARRAEDYTETERALLSQLFRRSCPPSVTIGEFALGALAGEDARAVAEHLLECPHCAAERRSFAAFLAEPDELPQPEGTVSRVLRRLLARPLEPLAPAAALRGEEDEETASYATGGFDLTIGVQQAARGSGRVVVGLLQEGMEPGSGAAVRLLSGDRLLQSTSVDDLGNFILEDVPVGEYRLELGLAESVIIVEPFRVR